MKYRQIHTCWIVITLLPISTAFSQESLEAKFDAQLNPLVENKQFSGSILIAKGDEILLQKGYGYADWDNQIPNTPDTKFRIGSLTKGFTSAAIMLLAEQRRLSTSDTLSMYLPDFHDGHKITIHHLLSHTSGIENFTSMPEYSEYQHNPTTLSRTISLFSERPLQFEPGSRFRYSNSNYIVLSFIIEHVTGMSYEQFLQTNIFDPLHMMNSGYEHNDREYANKAVGYGYDSAEQELAPAEPIDMSVPGGAGGLYSTVLDLYKWDRALHNDTVLSRDTKELMFTPVLRGYGYGWSTQIAYDNRRMNGHTGGINGFLSVIHRFPDDDVVIVLLSNIASEEAAKLMARIPAIYFFGYEPD